MEYPPTTLQNTPLIIFQWQASLSAVPVHDWQAIAGDHPFLSYPWLLAFEQSDAVGGRTGWVPHHLLAYAGERLVGAMPLYLKMHSYGEYVFDWAWAEAYERAGGQYYPKLLSAVPFSPVTGPRILLHPAYAGQAALAQSMLQTVRTHCQAQGWSGLHVLFPDASSASHCDDAQGLRRSGVQFRWENSEYADFAAFLDTLSHDKRKKIKQERNKVKTQGVTCRAVHGAQASAAEWSLFYACYCNTYYAHGSQPYLPETFFLEIAQHMPHQLTLFIASVAGEDIAVSLCVHHADTLYGRYWGALKQVSCLHFELCYYQPQQFCIAHGIAYFEGGAQGVHKLARGFSPYSTCSYHWLSHPEFHHSVAQFLQRESVGVQHYVDELEERSPYKATEDRQA